MKGTLDITTKNEKAIHVLYEGNFLGTIISRDIWRYLSNNGWDTPLYDVEEGWMPQDGGGIRFEMNFGRNDPFIVASIEES